MSDQLLAYRRKYSIKRDRDDEPVADASAKRAGIVARSESAPAVLGARNGDDADGEEGDGEDAEAIQYSLVNLFTVLETVVRHHSHVLTLDEHWALQRFRDLPHVAQTLWSRLHPRKYRVFRSSALRITKIDADDVGPALRDLAGAGFATLLDERSELHLSGNSERAAALLRLLKVAELRAVGAACGIVGVQKMARADVLAKLCEMVLPPAADANGQRTIALSGEAKQRDRAVAVERALRKVVFSTGKSASGAPVASQPSLLTMWGRAASHPAPPTSAAVIKPAAGPHSGGADCIVVLSHVQCELFDRINYLFFLNQSDFHAMALCNSGHVRYAHYQPNRFALFGSGAELRAYVLATHAVDFAQRQLGVSDDSSGYGSAAMAGDVPVPGRSLLLRCRDGAPAAMRLLLWLACVDLADCRHVDAARDPVAMCDAIRDGAGEEDGFRPLADELDRLRDLARPHSWTAHLTALIERDAEALALYEPAARVAPNDFVQPTQSPGPSAVSQDGLHFLHRFRREYAQLYLLRLGVDWLEKQRDYAAAIVVLRVLLSLSDGVRHHAQHKLGALWLRLSLDCAHSSRKDVALRVAHLALHDSQQLPMHATIKMQQRVVFLSGGTRKQKKQKNDADPHSSYPLLVRSKAIKREYLSGTLLTRQAGRKSLFEGVDGDPVTVEEFVLQHYSTHGNWSGMHCENSLWRSIVLLLLWDVVFDDSVPYVFQTPYQSAPLDLYTPFFFIHRRESIEARIVALAAATASDELRHTYLLHEGTQCGVSWSDYPCEVLCSVVDLLEPAVLSALLLYAARDFRAFSKGLPDLCIYRTAPRKQLALVEVKGPRDRLSPEQEAHLIQLCDHVGITAIVCHMAETKVTDKMGTDDDDDDDDDDDVNNDDEEGQEENGSKKIV